MLATAPLVGDYLADLGEGYAKATLRRKVTAIARACRPAGQPLDIRHPSIRDVLRGIIRTHGSPATRAQALDIGDVQRLVATCGDDPAGQRDRALLLLAFAGALRRSELCAVGVEHITWKTRSIELLLPRSKTDQEGEGVRIGIPRRKNEETCPVRAVRAWLQTAGIVPHPPMQCPLPAGNARDNARSHRAISGRAQVARRVAVPPELWETARMIAIPARRYALRRACI